MPRRLRRMALGLGPWAMFFFVLLAAPAGAAEPLPAAAEQCRASLKGLDGEEPVYLEDQCPELVEALDAHQLSPWLLNDAESELTVDEVNYLTETFIDRPRPARLALNRELLDDALADTHRKPEEDPSWWDEFVEWLKNWAKRTESEPDFEWLRDWVDAVAKYGDWIVGFLYGAVLLLAALAAVFLLRFLPWHRLTAPRAAAGTAIADVPTPGRALGLAEIRALPAHQQPAALLAYCIGRLVQRQWLPADASLTNRELGGLLLRRNPAAATVFGGLCGRVEAQVYGGRALDAPAVADCFAAAERLLALAEGGRAHA